MVMEEVKSSTWQQLMPNAAVLLQVLLIAVVYSPTMAHCTDAYKTVCVVAWLQCLSVPNTLELAGENCPISSIKINIFVLEIMGWCAVTFGVPCWCAS